MKTQQLAALKKSFVSPARTMIAAVVSLLAARVLGLQEAYWAPISTIIIMLQTNLDAALTVSWQRLVGTALGSVAGALLLMRFGPNPVAYGAGIFGIGLLCAVLRLDRAAYRFAGITLTVIMLAAHAESAWEAAIHRFYEVSLGIVVGVIVVALWPEQQASHAAPAIKSAP